MMKQIEMITECISTCDEIILFGHGYKSHSPRGAHDQFDDVTSLKNIYKHSLVILIPYHMSKTCQHKKVYLKYLRGNGSRTFDIANYAAHRSNPPESTAPDSAVGVFVFVVSAEVRSGQESRHYVGG
jgi:hypothetical protein